MSLSVTVEMSLASDASLTEAPAQLYHKGTALLAIYYCITEIQRDRDTCTTVLQGTDTFDRGTCLTESKRHSLAEALAQPYYRDTANFDRGTCMTLPHRYSLAGTLGQRYLYNCTSDIWLYHRGWISRDNPLKSYHRDVQGVLAYCFINHAYTAILRSHKAQ